MEQRSGPRPLSVAGSQPSPSPGITGAFTRRACDGGGMEYLGPRLWCPVGQQIETSADLTLTFPPPVDTATHPQLWPHQAAPFLQNIQCTLMFPYLFSRHFLLPKHLWTVSYIKILCPFRAHLQCLVPGSSLIPCRMTHSSWAYAVLALEVPVLFCLLWWCKQPPLADCSWWPVSVLSQQPWASEPFVWFYRRGRREL